MEIDDEFGVLSKDDKNLLSQKIHELKLTRLKKAEIEELEEIQKEELIELFKYYHLSSYSAHDIQLKYYEPKINLIFDSVRFKQDYPEIAEEYLKESSRREFLSIKFFDE
jgi:hypothetical protein